MTIGKYQVVLWFPGIEINKKARVLKIWWFPFTLAFCTFNKNKHFISRVYRWFLRLGWIEIRKWAR